MKILESFSVSSNSHSHLTGKCKMKGTGEGRGNVFYVMEGWTTFIFKFVIKSYDSRL